MSGITPSFSSDDYIHLENNIHFQNLIEALSVFTQPFGREYRPLVRLSIWLNHLMADTATPFKVTNLILHLINIVLLYTLLIRLECDKFASLIASCIFALHPIHITSIHFILGRTDLIASVFYFLTLISITYWNDNNKLISSIFTAALFLAALCSKELSITLPILMFIVLLLKQPIKNRGTFTHCIKQLWPFIFITAAYLIIRLLLLAITPEHISVYTNFSLINIINNYAEWAFALAYPFDLYIAQEWLTQHRLLFLFIGCFSLLFTLTLLTFICWPLRKHFIKAPIFGLGIIWIFIILMPMSGGNAHRWYLYLPSAGLSLIFVALWSSTSGYRQYLLAAGVVMFLFASTIETTRESLIWKKQHSISEAFFQDFEVAGLQKLDKIYFANMPFGYKSSFLFTFNSFQEAIRLRYGYAPDIQILSYVNLDDDTAIATQINEDKITFNIEPNAYRFFLLSANERRFQSIQRRYIEELSLDISNINTNGRIKQYSLINPGNQVRKIYYFDGKSIKPFNTPKAVSIHLK